MASCIFKPTIKNKQGVEVESKLFNDLLQHTRNRESAVTLWGMAQVPGIMEQFENILYDENGEVTLESLNEAININDFLEGKTELVAEKRKLNAVDNNGQPIIHKSLESVIDKVIDFNKQNEGLVATIDRSQGGYVIDVNHKTLENSEAPNELMFSHSLNNKLRGIMRSLGFDVETRDGLTYNGIFDALSGKETAEGLRTVIQIAKGEIGEEAFPEEFAHFMIEGLSNEPLVKRLVDSLNDITLIEAILGEDFETYNELYNNDMEMLQKEAAGKLLYAQITKLAGMPKANQRLTERIQNLVNRKMGQLDQSDIDKAVREASEGFEKLASSILDESILPLISEDRIMDSKPLYLVSDEVNRLKDMAEESVRILSKRLSLMLGRSKNSDLSEDLIAAIKNLRTLIHEKKYADSSLTFLQDILVEIETLHRKVDSMVKNQKKYGSNLARLNKISGVLLSIKEFNNAYAPIIKDMAIMDILQSKGEVELSPQDAKDISDKAIKIQKILTDIENNYDSMRFDTVYKLFELFWGGDGMVDVGKDKTKMQSLQLLMELAPKDLGFLDRWVNSLSNSSDALLSLTDKIFKVTYTKRDVDIQNIMFELRAAHLKLAKAGYNTEFMYERDENGELTGRIISDIDYIKFEKERNAYIDSLKEQNLSPNEIRMYIEGWEGNFMTEMVVDYDSMRTELVPIFKKDTLSKLSPAQRTYYDTVMKLKGLMDGLIPARFAKTHNAVYIRNGIVEGIMAQTSNPKRAVNLLVESVKDKFLERSDDIDFGNVEENSINKKKLSTDFSGKKIETLPIYYTKKLEDMDRLSTDFTGTLLAYSAMAVNYGRMNEIRDALELARDLILDREVQMKSGNKEMHESFNAVGKNYTKPHTKPGSETGIGARLNDYYSANLYGQRKLDEGTLPLFGADLSVAKSLDALKAYTTQKSLGLNLFTSINNVTMGKLQLFIESMGGEYFSYKDLAMSKKDYYAMLPEYLGELNSITKESKLGLLIDKYDALEEFNNDVKNKEFYKSSVARILGNPNTLFMSSAGEHYLHARNMIAMLRGYKVFDTQTNKEISLFEAYEVEKFKEDGVNLGGVIKLKENITKLDGSEFTENDFIELKLKMAKVSQSMNGAFNEMDKGAIHKYALGRLAMQFRQWMPAHYQRRLGKSYYDAAMGQHREGYYRTAGRFLGNLMVDLRKGQFEYATRRSQLSPHEKANLKRALAEMGVFASLALLLYLLGPVKDMSESWVKRMFLYQAKRLQLEVSASVPFTPGIINDAWKMLQSPAAAMQHFETVSSLLDFSNMAVEVKSGRFKGWSVWQRDLIKAIPYYNQYTKARDIKTESYMFNVFESKIIG